MSGPEDALRQVHEGETLRISDLADERGVVQNHDFLRCTIQGPALLVLSGGIFHSNRIDGFPDACFYDAGEDRERYPGAVIVYQCAFESCTFLNLGFTGPPEYLRAFKDHSDCLEVSKPSP